MALQNSSTGAWKRWALVTGLAIAIGLIFYLDLDRYLTFQEVKANRDKLFAYTESHYSTAVILLMIVYCVSVALSLPGAGILTVVGGFLFGSLLATIYVNIAATAGAVLAFLVARYLLRDWVERKFGYRLEPIQQGFSKNAFSYLLTLRLIAIFPFVLINLLAGLTRIRLSTYVVATALGIIPGTFVYAYAGRQLGTINSLGEILSFRVLAAFVMLGVLAIVPAVYKSWKDKRDRA